MAYLGVSIIVFFTEEEKYSDWIRTGGFEMFEMVVCTLCVTKEMSTTFPVTFRLNSAHIYETIFRTPHHTQFIILSHLWITNLVHIRISFWLIDCPGVSRKSGEDCLIKLWLFIQKDPISAFGDRRCSKFWILKGLGSYC